MIRYTDIDVDNVKEFADNCLDAQNLLKDNKIKFFNHMSLELGEKNYK